MGCNCKGKGGKQVINNLNSYDHLVVANNTLNDIINKKDFNEYDDLDKLEIMSCYSLLYPNSSVSPGIDDAIIKIKDAVEYGKIKYKNIK